MSRRTSSSQGPRSEPPNRRRSGGDDDDNAHSSTPDEPQRRPKRVRAPPQGGSSASSHPPEDHQNENPSEVTPSIETPTHTTPRRSTGMSAPSDTSSPPHVVRRTDVPLPSGGVSASRGRGGRGSRGRGSGAASHNYVSPALLQTVSTMMGGSDDADTATPSRQPPSGSGAASPQPTAPTPPPRLATLSRASPSIVHPASIGAFASASGGASIHAGFHHLPPLRGDSSSTPTTTMMAQRANPFSPQLDQHRAHSIDSADSASIEFVGRNSASISPVAVIQPRQTPPVRQAPLGVLLPGVAAVTLPPTVTSTSPVPVPPPGAVLMSGPTTTATTASASSTGTGRTRAEMDRLVPCDAFLNGRCHRGEQCPYSHNVEMLQSIFPDAPIFRSDGAGPAASSPSSPPPPQPFPQDPFQNPTPAASRAPQRRGSAATRVVTNDAPLGMRGRIRGGGGRQQQEHDEQEEALRQLLGGDETGFVFVGGSHSGASAFRGGPEGGGGGGLVLRFRRMVNPEQPEGNADDIAPRGRRRTGGTPTETEAPQRAPGRIRALRNSRGPALPTYMTRDNGGNDGDEDDDMRMPTDIAGMMSALSAMANTLETEVPRNRASLLAAREATAQVRRMLEGIANVVVGMSVDEMSYDELLALQERLGVVPRGTPQALIDALPRHVHHPAPSPSRTTPDTPRRGRGRPRSRGTDHSSSHGNDTCPICMDAFSGAGDDDDATSSSGATASTHLTKSGGLVLVTLPTCRHTYHVNCIAKWLASSKACPVCRTSVVQEEAV